MKINRTIKIFIFLSAASIFFYVFGGKKIIGRFSENKKDYQYLSVYSEVISLVRNNYVEAADPEKKFPSSYVSMLNGVDEFSTYLDAYQTRIFNLSQQEKAFSCGIYGSKLGNYFYITDIEKDSPSSIADLAPGDLIKGIQGKNIYGQPFWQMYFSLKSEKIEPLELIVFKKGSKIPSKVILQTAWLPSSNHIEKQSENLYLIRLVHFNASFVDSLKKDLSGLKSLKIILDLRKYAGGDFESFKSLSQLLFPTTAQLSVKTQKGIEVITLGSPNPIIYKAAVIINPSTIMYGELLAALLQQKPSNSSKITLVGIKTNGFISMLKHIPLNDSSSILITEGAFRIGDKEIAKMGVNPDIKLKEKDFETVVEKCISVVNQEN